MDYANEIRKSGKVQDTTEIIGFVLGATIAADAGKPIDEGNTKIYPRTYSIVLRMAHARTFDLQKKIKDARQESEQLDPEIEQVLARKAAFG